MEELETHGKGKEEVKKAEGAVKKTMSPSSATQYNHSKRLETLNGPSAWLGRGEAQEHRRERQC